jgi:Na+/proline symporter
MLAQVNYGVFVAAFAAYTLVVIGVGIYSARFAQRSDADYFLAGRSLGK